MKLKKLLSFTAAAVMTVTALMSSMSVSAAGTELSGSCGDNATWFINSDDVLVISGTGSTTEREYLQWQYYCQDVKKVLVEEGITELSYNDFGYCKNATEIIFPSTISVLGGCMSSQNLDRLKDIWVFSENVQNSKFNGYGASYPRPGSGVKWHVYAGSTTETSLREGLKLTDDDFEYISDSEKIPEVTNRTPVILPEATGTSGTCGLHSTWSWNESTKTLTFKGSGSITISSDFQKFANEIENVEMKDSEIISICENAFGKADPYSTGSALCPNLKSVTFPSTLKSIGDYAFNKTALAYENIEFPEGLERIGYMAFYLTNLSGALNIPSTVNYIGQQAFANTQISSLDISEGISFGGTVFSYCNNLKEVTIPKNLTYGKNGEGNASRANKLFMYCTGLERVILEEGATFAEGMFMGCTGITEVIIKSKSLESIPTGVNSPFLNSSGNDAFTDQITFKVYKGTTTEATLKSFGVADEKIVYLTDLTVLEEAISNAEKVETEKYTEESVSALNSAVEAGKSVMENIDVTEDEVKNAAELINKAIELLVEKPQPTEPSSDNPSKNPSENPTKPTTKAPATAAPKTTVATKATRSAAVVAKDKAAAEKVMKQAKITKLKVNSKAKKKITVTWKKVKKAVGYEVEVNTNKKFKKSKSVLTKTTAKKKLVIKNKKLKSGKKYYVRVRAYATYKDANGTAIKVYSNWNKQRRTVKVK